MDRTPEEIAYVAGFIDGEGSLQICRRLHRVNGYTYIGYSASVDVGSTNKEVLEFIRNFAGGGSIYPYSHNKKENNGNRKDAFMLRIGIKEAMELVKTIYPYLKVKKQQAEIFQEYPLRHKKLTRPLKENLFQEMRRLNHRGRRPFEHPLCVETIDPAPQKGDKIVQA